MTDAVKIITTSVLGVLTAHANFFESLGMDLFRSFAVILIAWFGIQSALSSASGGAVFNWSKFASVVMEILLVYVMLAFYSRPIPGFGISFTHLILDQATAMTAQLNQSRVQEILETLNVLEAGLPSPSSLEIMTILRCFLLLAAIVVAEAATLYVTLFGYIATGVLILLGPVFIPFKLVPQMDWMFWGWFRAFIQYAFYQVVATAYVFVFGDLLMQILGARTTPLSTSDLALSFVPMMLTLVTFCLGVIKVPSLTFSLFSGRSGDYIIWWR